jgi:hypothetical protein
MPSSTETMSVSAAADYLEMTPGAVRAAIAAGKIAAEKQGGSYVVNYESAAEYKRTSVRRGPPAKPLPLPRPVRVVDESVDSVTAYGFLRSDGGAKRPFIVEVARGEVVERGTLLTPDVKQHSIRVIERLLQREEG